MVTTGKVLAADSERKLTGLAVIAINKIEDERNYLLVAASKVRIKRHIWILNWHIELSKLWELFLTIDTRSLGQKSSLLRCSEMNSAYSVSFMGIVIIKGL